MRCTPCICDMRTSCYAFCFDPPSGPTVDFLNGGPACEALHNREMTPSFFRAPMMRHSISAIHFSWDFPARQISARHSLLKPKLSNRQMLYSAGPNTHIDAMGRAAVAKDLGRMRRTNFITEIKYAYSFLASPDCRVKLGFSRRQRYQLLSAAPLPNAVKPLHHHPSACALPCPFAAPPVAIGVDRDRGSPILPPIKRDPNWMAAKVTSHPLHRRQVAAYGRRHSPG